MFCPARQSQHRGQRLPLPISFLVAILLDRHKIQADVVFPVALESRASQTSRSSPTCKATRGRGSVRPEHAEPSEENCDLPSTVEPDVVRMLSQRRVIRTCGGPGQTRSDSCGYLIPDTTSTIRHTCVSRVVLQRYTKDGMPPAPRYTLP